MLFAAPRRGTSILLAVAGGVVCDAAFPGLGWWPMAFVAIAVLILALGRDSARWNAVVGFVFGFAFFLPQITWAELAVGPVPWIALSVLEAGFVAVFGAAWSWARRGLVIRSHARWQVPAVAVLWVGFEEARSAIPFGGFPWGRLAFSQADSPLARFAWLGGAPLVSLVVVVVGALLAVALRRLRTLDIGSASGAFVAAMLLLGAGWLVPLDAAAQAGHLEVGAVQGDVPDLGLASFDQARQVLDNHVTGTRALLDVTAPGELDLVVWPENGADYDPRTDVPTEQAVSTVAKEIAAPLLIGTLEYPPSGGRLNVALLWDPERGPVAVYAKQHPAPFAEYIPMRQVARLFSADVDRVRTDMIPGTKVGLIPLDVPRLGRTVGIADVICFEVAYDGLVREAVAAGGELLVVQTNNATFGRSDESTQQLAMSRLRAIEHGRTTIQISTVGVSAVISPNGVVTQQTGLFTAEQMVASIPLRTSLTPATRYGAPVSLALGVLAVLITLSGVAGAARARRQQREVPGAH